MSKFFTVFLLLAAAVALESGVPRPATELKAALPTGSSVSLAQYRGKVVAVEILNTTCVHCQRSAMALEAVYKELAAKGFQVLGVATNEPTPAMVREFLLKTGATFPVGAGDRVAVLNFLELSPVMNFYVPQIVIVDKKGVVRGHYQATDDFIRLDEEGNIRNLANKLLAE